MQRLLSTAVIKLKTKQDDTAADCSFTQVKAGLFPLKAAQSPQVWLVIIHLAPMLKF